MATVVTVAAALVAATVPGGTARAAGPAFDVQAHRGGAGLVVENTLPAFANALRLGVSTLELDVRLTRDGRAVVAHDRRVGAATCRDTGPAAPGDPAYPYVGAYVNALTLAQVRTLDCGSATLPRFPGQRAAPGARMPLLAEVFDLVRRSRATGVRVNVELKAEPGGPTPRERFVQVAAREIRRARIARQVIVQSFDWGALRLMRRAEPRLPLGALADPGHLQSGRPGRSPWLGGLDIDDFGGDPVRAARALGAAVVSPVHGAPPDGAAPAPGYRPYVTRAMVAEAHRIGLRIVPWTVNDAPTMNKLIDDGVDGLITDYPDRLRTVLAARGYALPRPYRAPDPR
ncbi:glycerophosphodiester phosphodiesterase [Actinomadura sp. PM05-2]|uniref:Glycerophosphodiester phosphodiesterase n=2 Tax=Actinomadura parmotrematis TaxID=2864039 RepID=A0ABS7FTW5_9ACTN|nr:glycerophosphodiester phosphodiesterase [Actinomadura parmotrematis]